MKMRNSGMSDGCAEPTPVATESLLIQSACWCDAAPLIYCACFNGVFGGEIRVGPRSRRVPLLPDISAYRLMRSVA